MKIINYISIIAMPMVILIIICESLKEKKSVFDIFLKGAFDGIKINLKIFPTLIGLSLALLRPISGSASMAIATDIIKNSGVDSFIGILASVIMGSTETTLYTIAVYTSSVKIKNTRGILIVALAADLTGIIVSFFICKLIF